MQCASPMDVVPKGVVQEALKRLHVGPPFAGSTNVSATQLGSLVHAALQSARVPTGGLAAAASAHTLASRQSYPSPVIVADALAVAERESAEVEAVAVSVFCAVPLAAPVPLLFEDGVAVEEPVVEALFFEEAEADADAVLVPDPDAEPVVVALRLEEAEADVDAVLVLDPDAEPVVVALRCDEAVADRERVAVADPVAAAEVEVEAVPDSVAVDDGEAVAEPVAEPLKQALPLKEGEAERQWLAVMDTVAGGLLEALSESLRVVVSERVKVADQLTPVGKGVSVTVMLPEVEEQPLTESVGVMECVAVVVFVLVSDAEMVFVEVSLPEGGALGEAGSDGAAVADG